MCHLSWNTSLIRRWKKDREMRYQHAADMRADLKRLKRQTESRPAEARIRAQVQRARVQRSRQSRRKAVLIVIPRKRRLKLKRRIRRHQEPLPPVVQHRRPPR